MIFYKRFIGDYQRDTGHLTMVEHSAYALMLDAVYGTGKPLPKDERRLYRLLGAVDPDEREAVQAVLHQFWALDDGGWVNARAMEEMESARKFGAAQKARIEKRWGGKSPGKTEAVPDALPGEYRNDTSHSHSHSHTPEPQPVKKDPSAHLPTRQDEKLDFEPFKAVYPKRSGAQPWSRAVKAATARIKDGAQFSAMIAGAERYAAFCEAAGKTGTEFVMQAATFLGPEHHFLEAWAPPASKAEAVYERNAQRAKEFAAAMPDIPPFLDQRTK